MIPLTKNGLPAMACLSAVQKCVRWALELDAMRFAVELHQTSKAYATMVANRLEIISHEDIDTQLRPDIVPFVKAACDQARAWYDPAKLGKSRMAIGNAIRIMARTPKSREGDHFHIAVGLAAALEGFVPEIPGWTNDRHTITGKALRRGLDHFRAVSTVLVPPAPTPDAYESEAYRLLAIRERLADP